MLESLKPGMTTTKVVHCADDHFYRAVYGLGPYIGDYPKQTVLAGVVQNWCPKFLIIQTFILRDAYSFHPDAQCQQRISMVVDTHLAPRSIHKLSQQSLSWGNSGMSMALLETLW